VDRADATKVIAFTDGCPGLRTVLTKAGLRCQESRQLYLVQRASYATLDEALDHYAQCGSQTMQHKLHRFFLKVFKLACLAWLAMFL